MKARIAGIERHSAVNGPGVRYVLFFQGCRHRCVGCQNPDTQPEEGGTLYETSDLIEDILQTKYLDGVTFSGGDPFCQPQALKEIASALRERAISIWAYSGWTYEELLSGIAGEEAISALRQIDVLVDGPFILKLLSTTCLFRGSSNQRLIDVQESLRHNEVKELDQINFNL